MFLFFVKVGSVLYGSGYVLLAFLRADLVDRWGWLTEQQLLDAVAVGQVTPGPVFTTATFIGYVLGGPTGAGVATVGIFLPGFFLVALSGQLVPRLRRSPTAGAFLDGVVVASLALMAVVTWELGRAAIIDVPTALLAGISAFLLLRFRLNSVWLVLGGAAVGILLSVVGARNIGVITVRGEYRRPAAVHQAGEGTRIHTEGNQGASLTTTRSLNDLCRRAHASPGQDR